jgi:rhodanese-related sulfurtransferase
VYCSDDSRYGEITRKELEAKIQSKSVTVIDVNSPESFKDQHIPSAFHYGSHEKDFSGMLPQKKEGLIVAYCGGPACTAWKKAATAACQLGYSNVKHFKPGIKGWKNPA